MTEQDFKFYYPTMAKKMPIGRIEGVTFNMEPYTVQRTMTGFHIQNCEPHEAVQINIKGERVI